jgi:hypothetical protein
MYVSKSVSVTMTYVSFTLKTFTERRCHYSIVFFWGNLPASELRRREITQKTQYGIQHTAKVRNQD